MSGEVNYQIRFLKQYVQFFNERANNIKDSVGSGCGRIHGNPRNFYSQKVELYFRVWSIKVCKDDCPKHACMRNEKMNLGKMKNTKRSVDGEG